MKKGNLYKLLTNCLAFLLLCFGGMLFGVTLALQNVSIEINGSTIYEVPIPNASDYPTWSFTYASTTAYVILRYATGDIVIPEKVKSSGKEYTITGIRDVGTGVTTLVIPATVTFIDDEAFYGSGNLTSVEFAEGSQLKYIQMDTFHGCTSLQSIEIPASVTRIGNYAFENCTSLTSVTFGEGSQLDNITLYTFLGCTNLQYNIYDNGKYLGTETNPYFVLMDTTSKDITSCEINNGAKVIAGSAFSNCGSLSSVIIPEGVTSIGRFAFSNCSSLSSITIPESVTKIDNSAFSGCTSLQYNIYDNEKYLGTETNPYFVLMDTTSTSITSCVINSRAKVIAGLAFYGCSKLQSINIPESVMSIGDDAFYGCSKLQSINIPESVMSIDDGAFYGCSELTSATFENTEGWSVTGISTTTQLSATDLSNSTTAATYLKSTYYSYTWTRA